jgi:hypothetical protein
VKAADDMMQVVSGPAIAAAPGLERLAKTLTTPAFTQLPDQLGQFSDILGELQARLGPLTQRAETAGGLFGGFRRPGTTRTPLVPEPSVPAAPEAVRKATAKKVAPKKKAPAKKAAPKKKAPAKKAAPKKKAAVPKKSGK